MIPPALIARASIPHDVGHGSSSSPCQSNRPAAFILPQTKSFSAELLSRTRFSAPSSRGSFVPAGGGRRRTSVCALSVGVFPHTFESLALALEMNLRLPSSFDRHPVRAVLHVVHCALNDGASGLFIHLAWTSRYSFLAFLLPPYRPLSSTSVPSAVSHVRRKWQGPRACDLVRRSREAPRLRRSRRRSRRCRQSSSRHGSSCKHVTNPVGPEVPNQITEERSQTSAPRHYGLPAPTSSANTSNHAMLPTTSTTKTATMITTTRAPETSLKRMPLRMMIITTTKMTTRLTPNFAS